MRLLRISFLLGLSFPLFAGCGLFVDVENLRALTATAEHAFATIRLFNCSGATRDGKGIPYPSADSAVTWRLEPNSIPECIILAAISGGEDRGLNKRDGVAQLTNEGWFTRLNGNRTKVPSG